jgi:hypothetical protein
MIIGTGFGDGATVTFGGVAATSVVVHDSNHISCVTGPHAAGAVDIVVTNPDAQTGTLASGYTYTAAVWTDGNQLVQQEPSPGPGWTALLTSPAIPTITSVSPAVGPTSGFIPGVGSVLITGTGFIEGAVVTFDGTTCLGTQIPNSKQIEAIPPAHAVGLVSIVVTNPDSQFALAIYLYENPIPVITGLSPTAGKTAGGDTLKVFGTDFVSPVNVLFRSQFGVLAAASVTFVNSQYIICVTPAHSKGPTYIQVVSS